MKPFEDCMKKGRRFGDTAVVSLSMDAILNNP